MLVKWFLAIPHLIVVGILVGGSSGATQQNGWSSNGSIGLITVLALVAVVVLAFNARYPRDIFALLMGLHRWIFRVYAYMLLMTDTYPPFRLDTGGSEPVTVLTPPVTD